MTIEQLRQEIDSADSRLLEAFELRMQTARKIGQYKSEQHLPVLDSARERQKLAEVMGQTQKDLQPYAGALYRLLFELSRLYQEDGRPEQPGSLSQTVAQCIRQTPPMFPQQAVVACQGTEGAFSQKACERIFKTPDIMYFKTFDSVFAAIESGLCRYGVLPVENSTAGSVNRVYDLMMQHQFSIVRSARMKIRHSLLAKKGTCIQDIRRVYSHPQALGQCSRYLASLNGIELIPCENTAAAARAVADSGRSDWAALASADCALLYGLDCLAQDVQDSDGNYTRFLCISRSPEIFPGADRTSLMMVLPHKAGSLYGVLSRLYAQGINLLKLESRPLPGRDFEFMFYFDLEVSVYSPGFGRMLNQLEQMAQRFTYLGSYLEIAE